MHATRTNPIRQLARAGLAAALPRRVYMVRGPRRSRAVCLTFDDGPHPEYTPRYLDLLAEHRVRATFFLVGRNAERYPGLVRRLVAEGHEVGSHSYSHPRREELTARQMADEVGRGAAAVERAGGPAPALYRPPRGVVTVRDLWGLFRRGQTVVLWNVDPKDYARSDAGEVAAFFAERPPRGGDLVLLHDVHPHALAALPGLIASVRRAGYDFGPVSAWLGGAPAAAGPVPAKAVN